LIRDLLDDVVLAANVAAGELRRVALRTDYDAASMLGAA
ncbi:MAG: hypothetical protein JWM85_391, partial [Acidimicrobiaceae bacterium]|nr:hypothetical protein [Acidimicrobiaceae bacterium]